MSSENPPIGVAPTRLHGDPLPQALRRLADDLEAGVYGPTDEATVVFPGASEIFHLGGPDNGVTALFNMTCGIHKIAHKVVHG